MNILIGNSFTLFLHLLLKMIAGLPPREDASGVAETTEACEDSADGNWVSCAIEEIDEASEGKSR